jgi:hypothetical protein
MQYARTLTHDEMRAVHFDIDPWRTEQLTDAWQELGFTRFPLDVIECTDRRIPRATLELAAQLAADGQTEVSVLIPRRQYTKVWHRLLHDRSSDSIAEALSGLHNCNVTFVPYHLGTKATLPDSAGVPVAVGTNGVSANGVHQPDARQRTNDRLPLSGAGLPDDRVRINEVIERRQSSVVGRVRSMRVHPWGGAASLECTIADDTGAINVVFLGRRSIPGLRNGTIVRIDGVAIDHHGRRAILNPDYTILSVLPMPEAPDH